MSAAQQRSAVQSSPELPPRECLMAEPGSPRLGQRSLGGGWAWGVIAADDPQTRGRDSGRPAAATFCCCHAGEMGGRRADSRLDFLLGALAGSPKSRFVGRIARSGAHGSSSPGGFGGGLFVGVS